MKQTSKIITGLLTPLFLTACSSDNGETPPGVMTLDIPIEIYSSSNSHTRAASQGDPGNDSSLDAPLYIYLYAYVKESDGNGFELLTKTLMVDSDPAVGNWTLYDGGTRDERWRRDMRVTFTINGTFDGTTVGTSRVFAIASREDLSMLLPTETMVSGYTTMSQIEAMTLDFGSWVTSSTMTLSELSGKLKDIYSTPSKSTGNGVISITNSTSGSGNQSLTCSTVKLYHVAAKMDFQWEVASTLQSTVELQSVTCTSLPTVCKIFEPTSNPMTSTTSLPVLGTSTQDAVNEVNEGNKWLGRACAYVLQPSSAAVDYTVTFGGTGGHAAVNASIIPDDYNEVYTGWYRVIATVNE